MIQITGLTKTYGSGNKTVHALNGVDLQINSGMFGLLGPNGAGKTTFMRILAGIVNPSGGSIRVDGHDLTTEAGKHAVKAELKFSVCTASLCELKRETLTWNAEAREGGK